jgi:hypothetical protein
MKKTQSVIAVAAIICFVLLSFPRLSYGTTNYIKFKVVLNPEDPESGGCDIFANGNEALKVYKAFFLSDTNIEELMIFRSGVVPGRVLAGFRLNESGKKNLSRILQKFPGHKIAIFADRALITVLPALPADSASYTIVIIWPKEERQLRFIARQINKKPESILALYVEETAKYNDVAAEAWGKAYGDAVNALDKKYKEARAYSSEAKEIE